MWPTFVNMLSWWQWLILAAVPPAIIALYFLKLKRRPLEVPSTFLWHRSIEDLHVNSIWQRLRRNLLLLLQLLLLAIVILALLQPTWQGTQLVGDRFIFLIDNSASMRATDVQPSRLDEAKRRAGEMIDQMKSGDVAMIISFADTARVEQTFTDDRRQLRRSLQTILPTDRPTSLLEALRVASGLANPGRVGTEDQDVQVAEALPADLLIFSDGRFGPVTGFSLGNLKPTFIPIGDAEAANIGILAFRIGRAEAKPDVLQAFARLQNFGQEDREAAVELYLDDRLVNRDLLTIPAHGSEAVAFPLASLETGILKLKMAARDHLAADDLAWAILNAPRRAKVLLVTPGNEPLDLALHTESAKALADVEVQAPEFLGSKAYEDQAGHGVYQLIVFDRCQPKQMPQANTLFLGAQPPQGDWSLGTKTGQPQIIDTVTSHPLLQWCEMGDVEIYEGRPLKTPQGGTVLIDSDAGPMMALAPRDRFEDVALGFTIVDEASDPDAKKTSVLETNWPRRPSFPVFLLNMLEYLGHNQDPTRADTVRPGQPITLESPSPKATFRIHQPNLETTEVKPGKSGGFGFTDTTDLGVYEVQLDGKTVQHFAVNLFDSAESNIPPDLAPTIKIGYVDVPGQSDWKVARREIWRPLLLAGLAVLLLEWYIYIRRVSL